MKVHVLTVVIVDHDELGAKEAANVLEWTRYANRCISPQVKGVQSYEVGEWDDDHPLNKGSTDVLAYLADLTPETAKVEK